MGTNEVFAISNKPGEVSLKGYQNGRFTILPEWDEQG